MLLLWPRGGDPVLGWSICNKYVYERPYECDLVDPDAQGLLTSTYSTASANVPADMGSELDLPPSMLRAQLVAALAGTGNVDLPCRLTCLVVAVQKKQVNVCKPQ